ncbi:hypothetical protein ABW20_dc0101708 [Dactylellina cionopaga]|nr:hypothetical protein ABW20_dc0101708 [Dactylellina cionopaga]
MADDVRRAVWGGSIPFKVLLDPSECRIFDKADAHWPVGLLYDFYTALDPTKAPTLPPTNHDRPGSPPPAPDQEPGAPQLPWTITLRFASYPHDLLPTLTPTSTHDAFINTIKEADFARSGTSKAVMSLSPSDTRQLFASLQDHDFDSFWSVSDKMLNHSGISVRNIPIRVYNPETGQVIQGSVPVRQPGTIRGDPHTLGTALNILVPILFPSKRSVVLARPVMHGIVLPLSVPLLELMREAMYPDGFLHITLAMM